MLKLNDKVTRRNFLKKIGKITFLGGFLATPMGKKLLAEKKIVPCVAPIGTCASVECFGGFPQRIMVRGEDLCMGDIVVCDENGRIRGMRNKDREILGVVVSQDKERATVAIGGVVGGRGFLGKRR